MKMDDDRLQDWIGRTRTVDDVVDPRQAHLMGLTLDREDDLSPGAPVPPLWHWI